MLKRLFQPLIARAERRLPALTRNKAAEPLPVSLDRRRIYIVPSGYGIAFGILLMVMLLGALNYSNNAALLLTCLLGAVVVNSMLLTFRALDRLSLEAVHGDTTYAGDPLALQLDFDGNGRNHPALQLAAMQQMVPFAVRATDRAHRVTISIPTERRGWISVPRLRVLSRYPFGWFRAWSWLAPQRQMLVYPRAEAHGPPPPAASGEHALRRREHGDEWAGLRDYRQGDPLKHVAWKASARTDELRVKTFDRAAANAPWRLQWSSTGLTNHEARIARLARWICDAHDAGRSWSLDLPGKYIQPGGGSAHFHRCMRALAELP